MPNRAVVVDGRHFSSMSTVARVFKVGIGSVAHRCASELPKWGSWKFMGRSTRIPSYIRYQIGRNKYATLREAAEDLGVVISTVRTRLIDPEYPTYTYVDLDNVKYRSYAELEKMLKKKK